MNDCIACGMPMREAADHAMGDENKDYCVHCANPDGSMHTFEQKWQGMTQFIVKTQGLDETAARGIAADMMKKLPAWQGCFDA